MKTRIMCSLLALTCATSAGAETLRVTPSKAKRLPAILKSLNDGDTVIFERGTYRTDQALGIDGLNNVTLQGEGRVEIVLETLAEPVFSVSNCSRIRIQRLKARHQEPSKEYSCEGAVVEVSNSSQVAVADCQLDGCGAAGVYARESQELVVFNNTIFNNTFAAVWLYDSSAVIHANTIYGNAADLITGGTCEVTMTDNEIHDNKGSDFNRTDWFEQIEREH